MGHLIELHKINRTFGSKETEVYALRDFSTTIDQGEFTAVVGPSGSGKSTLLNLIGALDTPSSGSIWLDGKKLESLTGNQLADFRRDHLGFVFQSYNLIPVLSAAENVEYTLLLQGIKEKERRQRTQHILDKVGLSDKAQRRPSELSGGQQQRVAIARAIVSKPRLILADEPTANLDSQTGSELMEMMRDLNQSEGTTFFFSTHDPMIMERAQRLLHLKDGSLEQDSITADR